MKFSRAAASSRCADFPFQELTLSRSSACAGVLVEPKLMASFATVCCAYLHSARHRM